MLKIVGFGSGAKENMTLEAVRAIQDSELVVGFRTYVELLKQYFPDKQYYSTNMMQERERCQYAIDRAKEGKETVLVCSGDSGVYGWRVLVMNGRRIRADSGNIRCDGGKQRCGMSWRAVTHDFAVISLSDCMTPWELIEKRLLAAAEADLVICLYNPSSRRRAGYLKKACEIVEKAQSPDTVCGYVKNIGRDGQETGVLSLKELAEFEADMFTTVYIGNSRTKVIGGKMVTPRGYQVR